LGYTEPAVTSSALKHDALNSERIRASLLGNSFHLEVVAWVRSHLAVAWGLLADPVAIEELKSRGGDARKKARAWESRGFCQEQSLVLEHMRSVSSKGSDVRISTGSLFHPSGWPRVPVDTRLWRWRTVVQFSWREGAHINELELRAFFSAFRWRLRSGQAFGTRFLHLLDSAASIAVLTKHRSSSIRLNRVARKVDVLELGSGSQGWFGFCRSSQKPADAPSRKRDATAPSSQ